MYPDLTMNRTESGLGTVPETDRERPSFPVSWILPDGKWHFQSNLSEIFAN